MITVDTSALVAVLRREPEATRFIRVIAGAGTCLLSAVSLHEAAIVLAGANGTAEDWTELDELVATAMQVVPYDAAQVLAARDAFLRFGKGRHPAALNLGDCAAYALARTSGTPLLFKGNDFSRTDLVPAI